MSKKVNYENQQELVGIESNNTIKVVNEKNVPFSINYGILINMIIIISIILFISICYAIGSFLANPLVIIGIIIICALFSIFNLLSLLEKEGENPPKIDKIQVKKEGS
jgi:hypothetical protein